MIHMRKRVGLLCQLLIFKLVYDYVEDLPQQSQQFDAIFVLQEHNFIEKNDYRSEDIMSTENRDENITCTETYFEKQQPSNLEKL